MEQQRWQQQILRSEKLLTLLLSTYLARDEQAHLGLPVVAGSIMANKLLSLERSPEESEPLFKKYEAAVHKWVSRVNSLVVSKVQTARVVGISLIKQTAEQSWHLLLVNGTKWCQHLVNILNKNEPARTHRLALATLMSILGRVADSAELQREIALTVVPKFNQSLVSLGNASQDLARDVLDGLSFSSTHFPVQFRPSLGKASALALGFLTGKSYRADPAVAAAASECLACLCKASGKKSYIDSWNENALLCAGTLIHALNQLTECIGASEHTDLPHFNLLPQLDDPARRFPELVDLVASMSQLMTSLLKYPTTQPVNVPIDLILYSIQRISLINDGCMPLGDKTEFNLLMLMSGRLYCIALRLTLALAISLRTHLAPYLSTVANAVFLIHANTTNRVEARITAYRAIGMLLKSYGFNFATFIPQSFYERLVEDSRIQNALETVYSEPKSAASTSVKKRGKRGRATNNNSSGMDIIGAGNLLSMLKFSNLSLEAIQAVRSLLQEAPSGIPSAARIKLDQQTIAGLLLIKTATAREISADIETVVPFYVGLLGCLLASVQSPLTDHKAALRHILYICSGGINSSSWRVRELCTEIFATCQAFVHPPLPSCPPPTTLGISPGSAGFGEVDDLEPPSLALYDASDGYEVFKASSIQDREQPNFKKRRVSESPRSSAEGRGDAAGEPAALAQTSAAVGPEVGDSGDLDSRESMVKGVNAEIAFSRAASVATPSMDPGRSAADSVALELNLATRAAPTTDDADSDNDDSIPEIVTDEESDPEVEDETEDEE